MFAKRMPTGETRHFDEFRNRLMESGARSFWRPVMATAAMAGFMATAVPALSQEDNRIEEVVVTAERREGSLQETAISMSAFTEEALAQRGFLDLSDIAEATPNLMFTAYGTSMGRSSEALVFIRGIGQTDAYMTADPGVGIYLDGVYLARAAGATLDLIDLERVEVLRGPQGTLFGRNTIGGAINAITAKPDGEFGGKMSLTLGDFDRTDVDAVVHFPIVEDKLFAKVAFASRDRDGHLDEPVKGTKAGDINRQVVRGALRWLPNDDIEVNLSADYARIRQSGGGWSIVGVNPDAPLLEFWTRLVGVHEGLYFPDFLATDKHTSFNERPSIEESDVWGVSLTVDWDIGDYMLKSITAYRDLESITQNDGDSSPLRLDHSPPHTEIQDQFSQEFTLSGTGFDERLNWLAGVYYFEESALIDISVNIGDGVFDALEALPFMSVAAPGLGGLQFMCPGAPFCVFGGAGNPINIAIDLVFDLYQPIENESYAVFTEGTFDITDQLSVTAGVRYTRDEKDLFINQVHQTGFTMLDKGANDSWTSVTPKFALEYRITPEHMIYFSTSRGFKSGGFNGRPTATSEIETYDEEWVTSYEVGFKTDWLDNRLRLNGALFYNDYTDIQLVSSTFSQETGGMIIVTENAGDGEIKGMELELVAMPLPELFISAGIGYTDFSFTDIYPLCGTPEAVGTTCSEVEKSDALQHTPEWTLNASAQYTVNLQGSGASIVFQGDVYYRSKVYFTASNPEAVSEGNFTKANARISYVAPDDTWDVALFVHNLTDKITADNGFEVQAFGDQAVMYGRPREWGVSMRYRF